jgi:hypothetical protein
LFDVEIGKYLIEGVIGCQCLEKLVVTHHILTPLLQNRLITALLVIHLLRVAPIPFIQALIFNLVKRLCIQIRDALSKHLGLQMK